jgi:uncharacterized protein YndB with AHSA1/START domain
MGSNSMKSETYDLKVESVLDAPHDEVFRAWTTPESLKHWYRPFDDWSIPVAEVDLTIGGAYRFGFSSPEGKPFYEVGEFREIGPPERLVYTTRFEGAFGEQPEETLVTVEFDDLGDKTRVRVAQQGYLRAKDRDDHQRGWPNFLERLGQFLDKRRMPSRPA